MKYLYPYECDKKGLSTPVELQAAIDGNRREGRRSSYGQFDSQMQGQLQMVNQQTKQNYKPKTINSTKNFCSILLKRFYLHISRDLQVAYSKCHRYH